MQSDRFRMQEVVPATNLVSSANKWDEFQNNNTTNIN